MTNRDRMACALTWRWSGHGQGRLLPARALLSLTAGKLSQGRGYHVATKWFRTLTPETVDVLVGGFDQRTSPLSSIIVHHCRGSATSVAPDATAFGMREPHFMALLYSTWEPATKDAAGHQAWTEWLEGALAPGALPGVTRTCSPTR